MNMLYLNKFATEQKLYRIKKHIQ